MNQPSLATQALGYCRLGLLDESWEHLIKLPSELRTEPDALEAQMEYALCKNRWRDALAMCRSLQTSIGHSLKLTMVRSRCLLELGQPQEALRALLASHADQISRHWTYFLQLARCQKHLGFHKAARDSLERALAQSPAAASEISNDPTLRNVLKHASHEQA